MSEDVKDTLALKESFSLMQLEGIKENPKRTIAHQVIQCPLLLNTSCLSATSNVYLTLP